MLAVRDGACTRCHGNLSSKRSDPEIQVDVPSFEAHPQFAPKRDGAVDPSALRFNHKMHLTSERVAATNVEGESCEKYAKLECASCHRPEVTGGRMAPVAFDQDCRCCHEQVVTTDIGSVTALHVDPEEVRRDLSLKILEAGVDRSETIFSGAESVLPGVRGRDPIDDSKTLRQFREKQLAEFEKLLYQPLDPTLPLFDNNSKCFLCHDVESAYTSQGDLPILKPTNVPARWLLRGEFSHRKHDLLDCKECHGELAQSASTSDVNLPSREVCAVCHSADASSSAGTNCILCHPYHDTSKDPALGRARHLAVPLKALLGDEVPQRAVGATED